MTSQPIHASDERIAIVAYDSTSDSKLDQPRSVPAPRGLTAAAAFLLRRPRAVDATMLFLVFLLVSVAAPIGPSSPFLVAVVATSAVITAARWGGSYTATAADRPLVGTVRAAKALMVCVGGFALVGYLGDFSHNRAWLPLAAAGGLGVLVVHRLIAHTLFARPAVLAHTATRIALIGDADAIAEFDKIEPRDPRRVVVDRTPLATYDDVRPALRFVDQIIERANNGEIDRVVVLATAPGIPVVNAVVRRCSMRGIEVDLLTGATGVRPSRLEIGQLNGFSTVHIRPGLHGRSRVILKRVFDFVVALVALVALSPVMIGAALAVRLGSSGPVFYKQRRLGRDGQQFEMIKFRSMLPNADQMILDLTDQNEADGPLFKIKDDPRITRVGGILRRTSIDELPQLWNVVRGEMSLVGPRPALAIEADGWPVELFDRLEVPPGITGLWQVNGRSNASFADYARLDLYYVDNWTIGLDIAILARTIPALLGRGAY